MTQLTAFGTGEWGQDGPCLSDIPDERSWTGPPSGLVAAALAQGLDALAHGIALFNAAGSLRYANAKARALLDRRAEQWSRLPGTATAVAANNWHDAVRRVCTQSRRELLLLPMGDNEISIALLPVHAGGEVLAIAVFGREEICGPIELLLFARSCELTHAETRVLGQLCSGLTARAVALLHGVSPTTVMTQIAAIRGKTASTSVRRLLDALAKLPPLVVMSPVRRDGRGQPRQSSQASSLIEALQSGAQRPAEPMRHHTLV